MKPLKLYWSRSKPNFGDWLSPVICEMLSTMKIDYADKNNCDLVAIGSLLDRFHENIFHPRIHVWGTGFIEDQKPRKARFHYHALRGKLSASLLTENKASAFGDPGLLADQIWPELRKAKKKYRVGLIPHYEDRTNPAVKSIASSLPQSKVIDVFDDVRDVLRQVSECELIFSSSLHGLIVSDAFGIPNVWMKLSDRVRGNDFKFHDYYSIYDLKEVSPVNPLTQSPKEVEEIIQKYHRPDREMIKRHLVESFPFRP